MNDLALSPSLNAVMVPQTFNEALTFADYIAKSDLVPKDYKSKPHNVLVAMQMGAELGLQPMQAIQNISVINGRPSLWGDAMLAICLPILEKFEEEFDPTTMTATCKCLRRGNWTIEEFSMEDAKIAGLWGKAGPWKTYPKRMLKMRARGFALRNACPDKLKGISSAEESEDLEVEEKSPLTISDQGTKAVEEEVKIIYPERESPKKEFIKDHDGYESLLKKVEELKLEAELNELCQDEWSSLNINRFNGVFKYVMTKVEEKKQISEGDSN